MMKAIAAEHIKMSAKKNALTGETSFVTAEAIMQLDTLKNVGISIKRFTEKPICAVLHTTAIRTMLL